MSRTSCTVKMTRASRRAEAAAAGQARVSRHPRRIMHDAVHSVLAAAALPLLARVGVMTNQLSM